MNSYSSLLKFTANKEHNIRRKIVRKTAPGLKNSLSLLKMSVQLGAAFTSIKAYKNITSIVCHRHHNKVNVLFHKVQITMTGKMLISLFYGF
jgi:hypothetical protein